MINSVETDTASLLAAHEAALVEMRSNYDAEEAELSARIEVLRSTAANLDAQLRAIATGGIGQMPTPTATETPPQPPPATTAPAPAGAAPAESATEPPARKARPSVRPELIQQAAEAAAAELESASKAAASADAPVEAIADKAEKVAKAETTEEAAMAEAKAVAEAMAQAEAEATAYAPQTTEAPITQNAVDEVPEEAPAEDESTAEMTPASTNEEAADVPAEPASVPEREPVAAGVSSGGTSDGEGMSGRKGSYYSRRSAKLPRIGNEAGRSALAAANAIRGASRNGGTRSESAEDRAARTA